jgi:DNA mismatch repair protein MutS
VLLCPWRFGQRGGLLAYLDATHKDLKAPLHNLITYTVTDYLILDHQTRRNLEITQTVRDGTLAGSLLWALDCTSTSMGSRALRRWLLQPLKDMQLISDRADTVEELFQHHNLRKNLRALLHEIYDIERLCSRIGAGTANARDLVALADSLSKLADVADLLAKAESPYLIALQSPPLALEELANFLRDTLTDSPPIYLTEGNIIRDGVNPQIDCIRQQSAADVEWLATLEKTERETNRDQYAQSRL